MGGEGMKKKIYICMSILIVFILSLSIVRANTMDTYGMSLKEMEMMEEYKKGNINTDEFIELRKAKADEYGLLDYCDSTYFLSEDFYDNYSDAYLIKNGLMILDRYSAGFETTVDVMESRASSVVSMSHHRYEEKPGYYIANGIWKLSNSHEAFCAQGLNASPAAGDVTSDPYLVENENLKKCLYYGYNGPGDILTSRYGVSGAIVLTSELVSNAYSSNCISKASNDGYHWNKVVGGLWNEIIAKPSVKNYSTYLVDVAGSAYNWQGVLTPLQKLAYGVYVPTGSVKLLKVSSKNEINQSNASYTFSGALYGLYKDSGCKEKIGEFKIDESGKSNVIADLELGTYYINEILAPHGYQKDTTIYTVKVEDQAVQEIEVRDVPQTNLVDLVLVKQDAQTGNKAQGMASLKDAKYEFKFYGGLYDKDPASLGVSPIRSWILKTDKTGKILMEDSYKVSGDAFYTDLNGKICLPLGTITVQEIDPPQGYLLDSTVYVQKLDRTSSTPEHISAFKTFSVKDTVNRLKLVKVQEGTQIPLPNVLFKHTMPNLPFPLQEKTNDKGEIEWMGLTKGKHTLTEFKTLDGYALDIQPIEFEVLRDGSISGVDPVITFSNKVNPFELKIVKKNNMHQLLDGAVFGLFKDSECKEKIDEKSTVDGVVSFADLKNGETYYLKEIKAPSGYQKIDRVYCIKTDFIPVKGQYDVYVDQEKVDGLYADGSVNLEFVNERMTKLPHTGSSMSLVCVVVGAYLMLRRNHE